MKYHFFPKKKTSSILLLLWWVFVNTSLLLQFLLIFFRNIWGIFLFFRFFRFVFYLVVPLLCFCDFCLFFLVFFSLWCWSFVEIFICSTPALGQNAVHVSTCFCQLFHVLPAKMRFVVFNSACVWFPFAVCLPSAFFHLQVAWTFSFYLPFPFTKCTKFAAAADSAASVVSIDETSSKTCCFSYAFQTKHAAPSNNVKHTHTNLTELCKCKRTNITNIRKASTNSLCLIAYA